MARPHRVLIAAFALAVAPSGAWAAPAPAAWEAELDRLIAGGRHAAAIELLQGVQPKAAEVPHHLARLVDATVKGYVSAINFELFAFKDLAPGETVQALRGRPGSFRIFNLGLDARLDAAYRKHAGSAELNLAIGRWLEAMDACGCAKGSALAQDGRSEATYYQAAEKAGLSDARSLFRIGIAQQSGGEMEAAVGYYERSLALDKSEVAASYNLAAAYFQLGDFAAAKRAIDGAVGRYKDPRLDADTYQVRGLVLLQLGDVAAAERDFRRSLELNPVQGSSFQNLIYLARQRDDRAAYEAEALRYISQDLGNTLMFNHYLADVEERGLHAFDRGVEAKLLALDPQELRARGALYFNLARMALMDGRLDEAEARFRIARGSIAAQAKPPEGAIEAIDGALGEIAKRRAQPEHAH